MKRAKRTHTVNVYFPGAGTNVDRDLFDAAGVTSCHSGCCLSTGDRDHGWEVTSLKKAKDLKKRLIIMIKSLDELNGRDLGATVKISRI